jgi:hypothetical protein
VVAVIVYVKFFRTEEQVARPDGLLAGTYPQPPSAAWTVTASSLLAGTRFSTPDTQATIYRTTGFIDAGDLIIVRILSADTADTSFRGDPLTRLVALDTKSGKPKWSILFDATTGCGTAGGWTEQEFWYGPDAYWRPANTLSQSSNGSTGSGGSSSSGVQDILVECEQAGSSGSTVLRP